MQVEQHWSEETSEDEDGMSGADLKPLQAPVGAPPGAGANSTGTSTAGAKEDSPRDAHTSGPSVMQRQAPQESEDAAEQHASQSGDGNDPAAVDAETEDGEADEAYVMAYLGRHMCPQEVQSGVACGGSMTPVGVHGDTYVCNMCDFERSETERVAELARTFQFVMDEAD